MFSCIVEGEEESAEVSCTVLVFLGKWWSISVYTVSGWCMAVHIAAPRAQHCSQLPRQLLPRQLISRCTIPFIAKSNTILVKWLLQNMRQNRKHRFDLVIWFYKLDDIIFYQEIEYFILCSGHKLMYFHTIIILYTIYINNSTTQIICWYEGSELPY